MRHPIVSCAQILHEGQNFDISEIPEKLQSFSESLHYPVHDAWLHFYEEDEYCKIYHEGLSPYINHIKKFAGAVSLDRSVGWSDNIEDQKNMNQVNKHSRKVLAKNGIPYITNVRFGDKKSYPFCFEDIPQNSVLFVGAHGTQNRARHRWRKSLTCWSSEPRKQRTETFPYVQDISEMRVSDLLVSS